MAAGQENTLQEVQPLQSYLTASHITAEMQCNSVSRQHLRSAVSHQLAVPSHRLSSYGLLGLLCCRSNNMKLSTEAFA